MSLKGIVLRIIGGFVACLIISCAVFRPVTVSKMYGDQDLPRDQISVILFQSPIKAVFIDGEEIKDKSNWNRIEVLPGKRKMAVETKVLDTGKTVFSNVIGFLSLVFTGYGAASEYHHMTTTTIELDAKPGLLYVLGTRKISDRTVVAYVQAALPFTAVTRSGARAIRLSVADYRKMIFHVVIEDEEGTAIHDLQVPLKHIRTAGKRTAFMAMHDGQSRMFVDGRADAPYDQIGAPHFEPSGTRLAYRVKSGDAMLMIVDGKEGKHYDDVGRPVFSPDGSRMAYDATSAGQSMVVVEGVEKKHYHRLGGNTIQFSPDNKRIAYAVFTGKKWFMVVDGKEGPAVDVLGYMRFSPDGKRTAYRAQRGNKWLMVVDDKEEGSFTKVSNPVFSSDSKRVAYIAEAESKRSIFINGVEGKRYDNVSDPKFSPDGKSVVYWAETAGQRHVVRDGKEGKDYDDILRGTPVFSPDSKHCTYGARLGRKWVVVVDDKEGSHYDAIFWERRPVIKFSPDGQYVSYQARLDSFWSGRQWQEVNQLIK